MWSTSCVTSLLSFTFQSLKPYFHQKTIKFPTYILHLYSVSTSDSLTVLSSSTLKSALLPSLLLPSVTSAFPEFPDEMRTRSR